MILSEDQKIIGDFKLNGYLIKKNFFDIYLIKKIFDEVFQNHDKVLESIVKKIDLNLINKNDFAIENNKIKYLKNANLYFETIKLLADTNLKQLATSLIGESVFVEVIELHQKYPGTSKTPPHQDNFYFCLKNAKSLTAYIPLNEQTKENGGLAVVPKTHNLDLEHYSSKVIGFSSGIKLTAEQETRIHNYTLETGDLALHHCNIVHLAPPNNSKKVRINIAIRFRSINEEEDPERLKRYNSFVKKSVRT